MTSVDGPALKDDPVIVEVTVDGSALEDVPVIVEVTGLALKSVH